MNAIEAGKLLTIIGLADNRTVTPEAAKFWAEILYDVDYDDAVLAAKRHFRESTDYLQPAHISRLARLYAAARREQARTIKHEPQFDPDGTCEVCGVKERQHRMLFCDHMHPEPGASCSLCEKPWPDRALSNIIALSKARPASIEDLVSFRLRQRGEQ